MICRKSNDYYKMLVMIFISRIKDPAPLNNYCKQKESAFLPVNSPVNNSHAPPNIFTKNINIVNRFFFQLNLSRI